MRLFSLVALALALVACGADNDDDTAQSEVLLRFRPDPPPAGEAHICFGFDPAGLAQRGIRSITWQPPAGSVALHHASLYAVSTSNGFPDGPVPCDAMPEGAVGLHVWAPGVEPLELPDDLTLVVPPSTTRLVIQAHALRFGDAPAEDAAVRIGTAPISPSLSAAWFGVGAPVPAIRPHHEETSSGACRLKAPLRALRAWPHMHAIGRSFHAVVTREGGESAPLVDVPDWDFDRQEAYPISIDIEPGNSIVITCLWQNPSDHYVLPGLRTDDEMCGLGLVVSPAASASCEPL